MFHRARTARLIYRNLTELAKESILPELPGNPAEPKVQSGKVDHDELKWYAIYTRSRFEKRLMNDLIEKGIEAYVPFRRVLHQWSDRKKYVDEPVIRSYCFVRINRKSYYEALNTTGAVRYIWFSGKPASIPDRQIETLRVIAGSDIDIECLPDTFLPGIKVKINSGPLMGLEGELTSVKNRKRVIIRIEQLNQAVTLSISPLQLDRVL